MFKLTKGSGRRNSNSGAGVAQASHRIVSPNNKFRSWVSQPLHTAFQDPPGSGNHGFDSNSPRVDERS